MASLKNFLLQSVSQQQFKFVSSRMSSKFFGVIADIQYADADDATDFR